METQKASVLFIGPLPPPYSGPELGMQQFLSSKILHEAFGIQFVQTNFRKSNVNKGKLDLKMVANFFSFFYTLSVALAKRPNLVYYPITPTQVGWLGRDVWVILLSKLVGAKIVIHLRGSHFKLNYQRFSFLAKKLVALALKQTDRAIVQAKYLNNQFAPYIPPQKVSVLYQAIDPEEYSNPTPEHYQKNKILVVGHMTKAKGYTDILKIIPSIADKISNVQFCFAGNIRRGERGVFYNQLTGESIDYEDPFEAEKKILSSPYEKNYQNLGIIKGKIKLHHFQSCSLFLSASYSEGFSRSLLEAMSMGKPIVYTPVGAHKEVLKNNIHGFQFPPGDLDTMKKAILQVLESPRKGEQIGRQNAQYAHSHFSISSISKCFKQILNQTLQS